MKLTKEEMQKRRELLWKQYFKSKDTETRNKIIIEYIPLVKVIASRLMLTFSKYMEKDDMEGYGSIGLVKAVDGFKEGMNASFETYANFRIRGEILDAIRSQSILPRTVIQTYKTYQEIISNAEKSGISLTEKEIADQMGISEEALSDVIAYKELTNMESLDYLREVGFDKVGKEGNPQAEAERNEIKKEISEALDILSENQRKVIVLLYYEELTQAEVAEIMEVSASRVSQLHSAATKKLREALGDLSYLIS